MRFAPDVVAGRPARGRRKVAPESPGEIEPVLRVGIQGEPHRESCGPHALDVVDARRRPGPVVARADEIKKRRAGQMHRHVLLAAPGIEGSMGGEGDARRRELRAISLPRRPVGDHAALRPAHERHAPTVDPRMGAQERERLVRVYEHRVRRHGPLIADRVVDAARREAVDDEDRQPECDERSRGGVLMARHPIAPVEQNDRGHAAAPGNLVRQEQVSGYVDPRLAVATALEVGPRRAVARERHPARSAIGEVRHLRRRRHAVGKAPSRDRRQGRKNCSARSQGTAFGRSDHGPAPSPCRAAPSASRARPERGRHQRDSIAAPRPRARKARTLSGGSESERSDARRT